MRNFRTSWLSREILGLSSFGLTASIYAAMLLWGAPGAPVVGGLASLIGVFGLYAGARIYLVPSGALTSSHLADSFVRRSALDWITSCV